MRTLPLLVATLVAVFACKQENPYDPNANAAKGPPPSPPKIIGIDPDKFQCTKLISVEEISKLAGGDEVVTEATGIPVPNGTPAPCTYIAIHKFSEAELKQQKIEEERRMKKAESGKDTTIAEEVEAWGKNLDRVYGMRFDCRGSAQQQHQDWMNKLKANAEAKAHDVQVGKGGVDHIGGELVFLDDDTPCAVVITAPDEAQRLTLAQMVQSRLVLENAPMTPRAVAQ